MRVDMRQGRATSTSATATPNAAEINNRACSVHSRPSSLNSPSLRQLDFDPFDLTRLFISAAFGVAVALVLVALPWRMSTRILIGWDLGVVLYLALSYRAAAHASIATIRQRASINDNGAIALLVLAAGAALASLAAVLAELGHAPGWYQVALGVSTILLSWAFMHWIFALHGKIGSPCVAGGKQRTHDQYTLHSDIPGPHPVDLCEFTGLWRSTLC